MADTARPYVVVAFSPQSSVAYFMKGVLDCCGLTAIAISAGPDEIEAVAERVHPDAIVYDLSFPFVENWQRFQQLRDRPALQDVPFVITTSEVAELQRRVGVTSAIELFTRPKDLAKFQAAVHQAIESASAARTGNESVHAA
jgi:CheY-like chemotaxis protein